MDVTVFFLVLINVATLGNCQVFTVTTEAALEVCEVESLPLSFSVMCAVDPAAVVSWEVTGVTPPLGSVIARGVTVRSFSYPNVMGQATLNVNDSSRMDVTDQTCFICRADYPSGNIFRSDPLCVDVAGTPAAPRNIISTGCAVVWSPSAPGLSYRISVCRLQSTLNCPIATNCTNCSFASITGITESGSYNITVCSSSVVNGVPCMSEACAPPIIVELNPAPSPSPMTCTTTGPIGYTPDSTTGPDGVTAVPITVIAGVAVGSLLLSLLLTAATGVITFLCTRRCYNKKSSPPSPNEKSVCYATVQSDSVQMQPSPAYQSVGEDYI